MPAGLSPAVAAAGVGGGCDGCGASDAGAAHDSAGFANSE
jgi:hypothetical protein